MAIKLGSTNFDSLYLGSTKIGAAYLGNVKVYSASSADPYNPLGLPAYTIRIKFKNTNTPSFSKGTAVQVSSSPNVWDLTYNNSDWSNLLESQTNIKEVLGANTSSVTDMSYVFSSCSSLTTIPLFDTSSVTNMAYMCYATKLTAIPLFDTSSVTNMTYMCGYCTSLTALPLFDTSSVANMDFMCFGCSLLTAIPLFDTSSVTNMGSTFKNCRNVESGSLALYQQATSQTTPPYNHNNCFTSCGSNTTSGAAELAQIPASWGGTGA